MFTHAGVGLAAVQTSRGESGFGVCNVDAVAKNSNVNANKSISVIFVVMVSEMSRRTRVGEEASDLWLLHAQWLHFCQKGMAYRTRSFVSKIICGLDQM